ncbi:MAG: PhnD/SsuA/transferrin family substrate-binding protein [Opitutae bacterium]|nr:PhnD/SsuA/transferrin family substrate-binding protein [Opitutae bacterium]
MDAARTDSFHGIRLGLRWLLLAGLLWSTTGSGRAAETVPSTEPVRRPFRAAFTSSMFTEVNENDARAAMKVWIMTVARERNIPVDDELTIFSNAEAALRSPELDRVDGFALTAEEFGVLRSRVNFDRIVIGLHDNKVTEQYVLLIHNESGREQVADFRGRSLLVLHNPRMSVALTWLDTYLLQQGLPRASAFWSRISSHSKPSRVALPVFFHQTDACIMTRRSFDTMCELNPQIGKQLRILATSPEIIPSMFALRADSQSVSQPDIIRETKRLNESPAGQQILTLTQSSRAEDFPVTVMHDTLELISLHRRLLAAAKSDAPAVGPPAAGKSK